MTMPQDAIDVLMTGTPTPLHLWVMNETSGTTFADQAASGNKPLTKNAGCTVNGWGTITGRRGYGGPQTPAPTMGGATGGASAAGATLGGQARGWGIIAFMDSNTTNFTNATLYCERGSSGNDQITWYINGGAMALAVCDDTAGNLVTATSPTSNSAVRGGEGFVKSGGSFTGGQLLGVSVDATGKADFYCNGHFGIGQSSQTISSSHTWTNAGLTTNIGVDPANTANAFPDALCWVAVFNAPFTRDQFWAWYTALTPIPAHGQPWSKNVSGLIYPNSAFWNTPLPSSPPVDPDSSSIISQWLSYQSAHSGFQAVTPYVPLFDLQQTGRGVAGIRTGFIPGSNQHIALSAVPTPDTLSSGDPYPSNLSSDAICWVVDSVTGQQYDIFTLLTTANGNATNQSSLYPPYINTLTPSTASGTLPAGTRWYAIAPVNSNGEGFSLGGYQQGVSATLSGTGKITLSVLVEVGGSPPPTSWRIYVSTTSSSSGYQLLTTVTGWTTGTMTFVDDGSFTPSAGTPITLAGGANGSPWGTFGSATTQDWGSKGGGMSWDHLLNVAFNPTFKDGTSNNGESASNCPAGAGVITVEEALNGVIPHPIAISLPTGNQWQIIQGRRWPALRHDGTYSSLTGFPTMEGMRLQLDPSINPDSLTYSATPVTATFQKAFVVAAQTYGLINRDSGQGGGGIIYVEDTPQSGRDYWPRIQDGLFSGTATTANAVLGMFPWSSLRVLMPFRYSSKKDAKGRLTNRLDVAGYPTPAPY